MIEKIRYFLEHNAVADFFKRIRIKQLGSLSLWQLGTLYFTGVRKGLLSTRAAAISWNFFFGFFPFLLFLFSVLPLLPHYQDIEELFWSNIIYEYIPEKIALGIDNSFSEIAKNTDRKDIVSNQVWFILLSIYLASNAIFAFLTGFINSYHYDKSKRGFIQLRAISIGLTLFYTLMIIAQLVISYYTKYIPLAKEGEIDFGSIGIFRYSLNYITGFFIYLISVIVLFYIGYGKKKSFKSLMASSLITAIGFIATIFLFGIYIQGSKLDSFYGVIGTLMIFMLFIYFNVVLILVGFELNAMLHSIKNGTAVGEELTSELKSFD